MIALHKDMVQLTSAQRWCLAMACECLTLERGKDGNWHPGWFQHATVRSLVRKRYLAHVAFQDERGRHRIVTDTELGQQALQLDQGVRDAQR